MPVNEPGERWPLWSAPLGASVLWVMTRRESPLGPHAARTNGLSSRLTANSANGRSARRKRGLFRDVLLQPIRILQRKRDPAFAQQPCQQAHRHPNDVVVGPPDRGDQAATFALYSVGTGLILRLARPHVGRDRGRR